MTRLRIVLAVFITALFVLPSASALWRVHGTYEPDTIYDQKDGFMWHNPDWNTGVTNQKVYFNVVADLLLTGQNPNNGFTGSRIWPAPGIAYNAYYGVWRDCNRDGYIGMADGAVSEYLSVLLRDTTVCPDGTEFNKNGWVYEMIWVGPQDTVNRTATGEDRFRTHRLVNDTDARVWGDFGLPGDFARGTCPINPPPQGTTGSTGGMLNYFDCFLNRQVARNVNSTDKALGGNTGLGFENGEEPHKSKSLLNQDFPLTLWGNPYAGPNNDQKQYGLYEDEAPPVYEVFDCSKRKGGLDVRDPTAAPGQQGSFSKIEQKDPTPGHALSDTPAPLKPYTGFEVFEEDTKTLTLYLADEEGSYFYVAQPHPVDPTKVNPTGSYYSTINNTEKGVQGRGYPYEQPMFNGTVTFSEGGLGLANDGCDSTTGTAAVSPEDNHEGSGGAKPRDQTDVYFYFTQEALHLDPIERDPTFKDAPWNFGLRPVGAGGNVFNFGPKWYGLPNYVTTPQSISRRDLQPEGASYATFYAKAGNVTKDGYVLPNEAGAKYGYEWCGDAQTGVKNGTQCDPDLWWPIIDGKESSKYQASQTPELRREMSVRVHETYHLRDVDCWDGTVVRGVPVYASLVLISEREHRVCADSKLV